MPFANAAPNLTADIPAMLELAAQTKAPLAGNDMKTGQTLIKTMIAPGLKARMIGVRGLVLDQHPRQSRRRGAGRSGIVQDQGREQEIRARLHLPAAPLSRSVQGSVARRPHQLLPAARRQQGRLGQHRHRRLARLPDAAEDQLPVPRFDPGGADRPRLGVVPRSRQARRHVGHPGVAVVLLQGADARARIFIRSTICSSS